MSGTQHMFPEMKQTNTCSLQHIEYPPYDPHVICAPPLQHPTLQKECRKGRCGR